MPINIAKSYNNPKGCYVVLVMFGRGKNNVCIDVYTPIITRDCERFISNELSNFFFSMIL
jgi:hypothetical protein